MHISRQLEVGGSLHQQEQFAGQPAGHCHRDKVSPAETPWPKGTVPMPFERNSRSPLSPDHPQRTLTPERTAVTERVSCWGAE